MGKLRITRRGKIALYTLYGTAAVALLMVGFWWEAQLLPAQ